jgi:hypothetical protein
VSTASLLFSHLSQVAQANKVAINYIPPICISNLKIYNSMYFNYIIGNLTHKLHAMKAFPCTYIYVLCQESFTMEQYSNIEKKLMNQMILSVGNEEKRVLEKVDN